MKPLSQYTFRTPGLCTRIVGVLATTLMATTPLVSNAYDIGDWLVRGRIIHVSPNDDSDALTGLPGTAVSVGSDTTLEVDFTYMVTKNIGVELILASSEHDVSGEKGLVALGLGSKVLDARTLPPVLTVQYHFLPNGTFQPYAGVGLNYTLFFNEEATNSAEGVLGITDVELDDSFGFAAQIGADIDFGKSWFANIDVKYVDMNTEATLKTAGLGTLKVDVDIDPWIVGIGIGKKF